MPFQQTDKIINGNEMNTTEAKATKRSRVCKKEAKKVK